MAKWLGATLLVSYALYVALATSFLSFGGLAWATKNEEDVRVEVDGGYSLFPGRVHVRGLKLRVKDYNIEMEVLLDSADASVSLWKLPSMELHVPWVRAHGAEYKLVHRVSDPVANAERLKAFPEIPGFDRPLHYDAPRPPTSDAKLWSVRFDSIEADVRFAWILEYQVRGTMWARGAFFLDPNKEARVLPCQVDVEDAEITILDQHIARRVRGTLSASVLSFDPRNTPTEDVIPRLSAGIERVSADLETLSFAALYLPSQRIDWDGKGQLGLDLKMIHGQIRERSMAQLELAPVSLRTRGADVRGWGRLELRAGPQGKLETKASFSFPNEKRADARPPNEEKQAFSAEVLEAEASFEHEDITALNPRRASFLAERVHFATPTFLEEALGKSRALPMSGSFDAQVLLDLPNRGDAKLDAAVATRSTSFYLPGLHVGATAEGHLHCEGTRAEAACALESHAPYLLFDQEPGDGGATLWLRARTRQALKVSVQDGTLSGTVHLIGGDPKALVSELIGEDWIAQLGLTLVPTGELEGTFHVSRTPTSLSFTAVDLSSGSSRVQGHLHADGATSGAWVVDMPTNRWGFELKPDGVSAHPFVGSDWLAAH